MEFFKQLLTEGKTQFHVVELCKKYLSKHSFSEITDISKETLNTLPAGRYYISPFSSMLIPFVKGDTSSKVRIASAHTDFPMLKIKSQPEMLKQGYAQTNVEPYGGLIKETWFDRPLGLAGKIICKSDDIFSPKVVLFDSKKPMCIIPNLAPHLKRGGKSEEIDVQKEMIPIWGTENGFINSASVENDSTPKDSFNKSFLMDYLASSINCNITDILDYDLYLYNCDTPVEFGINDEFITSPRIDNLSSVAAVIEGICDIAPSDTLAVGALFDNEEIGSRSKQGADSTYLATLIEALVPNMDLSKNGFYFSMDVAHGTHPNYAEKSDPTNPVILGKGVVLKSSASQRYVSDSEASGVFIQLCEANNIKFQKAVNKSGMPGGQTLGPIMSSYLPMRACDLGIPVLAMHSASELMHKEDYAALVKVAKAFLA